MVVNYYILTNIITFRYMYHISHFYGSKGVVNNPFPILNPPPPQIINTSGIVIIIGYLLLGCEASP